MNTQIISQYTPDHQLDTSGLNCPLPLLKLKQQLNNANTGDTIYLLATDPHSEVDIGRFCERAGHGLQLIEPKTEPKRDADANTTTKTQDGHQQNQIDSFHFLITKLVTK